MTPTPSASAPSDSSRVAGLAPGHPWQLGLGLVAWSVWFVVVYGGLSVGCAVAEPMPERRQFNVINGTLLLVSLALVLWLALASRTCARAARRMPGDETAQFIAHAAAWLYAVAAVATVFVGAPMLALWPCV
jgi:hypothetical protein